MKLENILSGCEYEVINSNELQVTSNKLKEDSSLVTRHSSLFLDTEITDIAYDSRKVTDGAAFVAIKGEHLDGHDFVDEAIGRGAAVIVYEKNPPNPPFSKGGIGGIEDAGISNLLPIFIKVNDSRRALACLSNNFYRRPSENLSVIGVTGTNGKTTTTYLIKSILEAWKKKVGLIGTICYNIADKEFPASHTTPESPEFQGLLNEIATAGCSHVVAEVSSHALSQMRVDYTRFAIVVFTNLTRDHLDFHETMENYFAAKERLFTEILWEGGTAAINIDDEWGRMLLKTVSGQQSTVRRQETENKRQIITYGIEKEADIIAADIQDLPRGVSFILKHGEQSFQLSSPLSGMFNVYNILAAASAAIALGVSVEAIRDGIRNCGSVKGRFEKVDMGQGFLCFVDYAHTPDAIERLILAARELIKQSAVSSQQSEAGGRNSELGTRNSEYKIITVFGCGGDRDRGKRPVMGGITTKLSDYVIVTSDNPRSENPDDIIKEIVSGVSRDNYIVVPDRRSAIAAAVEKADNKDIILIAGKGHEDYQEIKGVRYKFSDTEVAAEAIKNRLKLNSEQ